MRIDCVRSSDQIAARALSYTAIRAYHSNMQHSRRVWDHCETCTSFLKIKALQPMSTVKIFNFVHDCFMLCVCAEIKLNIYVTFLRVMKIIYTSLYAFHSS